MQLMGQQIRELENKLSSLRPKTSKFSFAKSKSTPKPFQPIKHDDLSSQPSAGPSIPKETETKDISSDVVRFENLRKSVIRLDSLNPNSSSNLNTSSTVILKNLEMCIIDLRPSSSSEKTNSGARTKITSLHGEGLRYCTLIVPVDGSVLLHSLTSCILVLSCHQVSHHLSTKNRWFLTL